MSVRRRLVVPAAAFAVAIGVAACGEDDFPNEPRPPVPIEVTANVTDREIVVSPKRFGAGPVNVTATNQSQQPATLVFDGPTAVEGDSIAPGDVGEFKALLEEGDYEVSGGPESEARAGVIEVGPERPSSQNDLLLP